MDTHWWEILVLKETILCYELPVEFDHRSCCLINYEQMVKYLPKFQIGTYTWRNIIFISYNQWKKGLKEKQLKYKLIEIIHAWLNQHVRYQLLYI